MPHVEAKMSKRVNALAKAAASKELIPEKGREGYKAWHFRSYIKLSKCVCCKDYRRKTGGIVSPTGMSLGEAEKWLRKYRNPRAMQKPKEVVPSPEASRQRAALFALAETSRQRMEAS